jgi:hypothetical protein
MRKDINIELSAWVIIVLKSLKKNHFRERKTVSFIINMNFYFWAKRRKKNIP